MEARLQEVTVPKSSEGCQITLYGIMVSLNSLWIRLHSQDLISRISKRDARHSVKVISEVDHWRVSWEIRWPQDIQTERNIYLLKWQICNLEVNIAKILKVLAPAAPVNA